MASSSSFVQADSRNLPDVNMAMILEYFHTSDNYNIAEIRGVKTLMASRNSYVDSAVGYVEVKRENNICTVQAKVVPEHKINRKYYVVVVCINEQDSTVSDAKCNSCPASAGGCKHTLVLLFWLEKKASEPSSTSVECYWKKPRLGNESMQPVVSKDLFQTKKSYVLGSKDSSKLKNFFEECRNRNITDSLATAFSPYLEKGLSRFCIFDLILEFIQETDDHSFEKFKSSVSGFFNDNIIKQIEQITTDQANSKLWHSIRQARITGSKIYEACHCSLVERILGGYKVYETKAMKRGKKLEKEVIEKVMKLTGSEIKQCGFKLINPISGASPDGIATDFIVEVKCPSTAETVKNYITCKLIKPIYYAQCQFEMLATGYKKCAFVIADPKFEENGKVEVTWVDFNSSYAEELIIKGELFWKSYIYPKILESAKS